MTRKDADEVLEACERVVRENQGGSALRGPDGRFISNELGEMASSDDELPARNGLASSPTSRSRHVPIGEISMRERPFFRELQEFTMEELSAFLTDPLIPQDEKVWFLAQHE